MRKDKINHTPGPWNINDSADHTITVVAPWSIMVRPENTSLFGDYRGGHICDMHYNSGVPTKEQALANAKLIAAAPEMLRVLNSILIVEKRKYADRLEFANVHNNTDGVGIDFDYVSAEPLPQWATEIEEIIKKATDE